MNGRKWRQSMQRLAVGLIAPEACTREACRVHIDFVARSVDSGPCGPMKGAGRAGGAGHGVGRESPPGAGLRGAGAEDFP